MALNLHREAAQAFSEATGSTQTVALPVLEMLSEGFQINWFREASQNIWTAVVKPTFHIAESFGLQQEYFVIGNGYPTDFHQRTLKLEPPAVIADRLDSNIRFVASDAPIAEAFCAAWAQKNKATIVRIRSRNSADSEKSDKDRLYGLLSTSLWRRDFFAEAEPVKEPSVVRMK